MYTCIYNVDVFNLIMQLRSTYSNSYANLFKSVQNINKDDFLCMIFLSRESSRLQHPSYIKDSETDLISSLFYPLDPSRISYLTQRC